MQNEFSSVEFINEFVEDEKMEDHVKTDKQEEGKEQEEQITKKDLILANKDKRAFTWITMAINEDQQLFYVFSQIIKNGSFLSFYDEGESFLFKDRVQVLSICQQLYENRLRIEADVYKKYQEWQKKKLE